MVLAATDMTGWWVGYAIGGLVVVIVAAVALALIATASRIADVAEDATRALVQTRDRTEVLWQVATTNAVATDLLNGATQARHALGGGYLDPPPDDALGSVGKDVSTATGSRKGLGGNASGLAGEPPPQDVSGPKGRRRT